MGGIRTLKARSVIVDMECGVINEMLKGPLGDVLDTQMMISDVSGAGNNWAHGNHVYGPQYRDQILERIRRTVEACDSLQSFLLLHSLGGGTGSGVGTYILEMLAVRRGVSLGVGTGSGVGTYILEMLAVRAALTGMRICLTRLYLCEHDEQRIVTRVTPITYIQLGDSRVTMLSCALSRRAFKPRASRPAVAPRTPPTIPPQDQYPDVFRFTASVFPSEDDDVVTSPYNAMLSLSKLVEFADCVLPIENQALAEIVGRVDGRTGAAAGGGGAVPAAGVLPEPGRGEPGRAEEGAVVLDSREPSVYQAIDLVALGGGRMSSSIVIYDGSYLCFASPQPSRLTA